jgi:hypothetical protein
MPVARSIVANRPLIRNAALNRYQQILWTPPAEMVTAVSLADVLARTHSLPKRRLNALVSANPFDMEAIEPFIAVTSNGSDSAMTRT